MAKRIAIVEKIKCDPTRCAKECIKFDPINRSGGEGFHLGEDGKATIANEVTNESHQICAKKCPFEAIKIVRLPEEASGDPIHQYGENGFRLFNLPIPQFGKVVGLLGRNGIGKSTAVNILSGVVKANFGQYKRDSDSAYDALSELISHYKGSVAQTYFEKMRDGEIKVALKPQAINMIPKAFGGTVSELLSKTSTDSARIADVCDKLSLTRFMDRNISDVSGGELQRIAIAATLLKDANVYIFDEPSSFLDIKQRLRVAQILRDLATEDTAVLVIEHDLIILDYMTDLLHITYGEQAAFGVVSQVKSSRNGINMYLEGYMRDQNIQFRANKIRFYGHVKRTETIQPILTEWEELTIAKGSFSLKINPGKVYKHDVIGILGENGIGKTTFAKLIAGVEKGDTGSVDGEVKISYKPQYIDTDSEELVMQFLGETAQKYEATLLKPLGIDKLMEQELRSLSGGQLQIVTVVKCLLAEAQVYLLDEPSANLDTEQRLLVSKIIKDMMLDTGRTALVIDHDLLFIDYLSDKILVFDGIPAIKGETHGPFDIQEGMNAFLKDVGLTFRRDEESNRPRANKVGSQMDEKQKKEQKLYVI